MRSLWLFAALSILACAPPVTISIGGDRQQIDDFSATLTQGFEQLDIDLIADVDPLPRAIDDELRVTVVLSYPFGVASVDEEVAVGTELFATFQYFCDACVDQGGGLETDITGKVRLSE